MPTCLICDGEADIQVTVEVWACVEHFDETLEAIRDWKEGI